MNKNLLIIIIITKVITHSDTAQQYRITCLTRVFVDNKLMSEQNSEVVSENTSTECEGHLMKQKAVKVEDNLKDSQGMLLHMHILVNITVLVVEVPTC